MLTPQEIDWLRLVLIPEIGPARGKSLLAKFKTPKAALEASLEDIAQIENIGPALAGRIIEARKRIDRELGRQIKLIEKNKVKIIPLGSEFYPANLKAIYDPPLVLFVKGEIFPQDYFSIAIVGTRLASFYGRSMSEKISRQLAEKGFTVASGGARGIDSFAHKAALRAGGRTLAVLGCGLDVIYPKENKNLFEEIYEKGALISEFPLTTEPDRKNFPMRNRIISGLSLGVVVIEAPLKSGALITVTHANDQGREVFSVPGQAGSFISKGTNQLLREGAKLVENADDIIEELEPLLKNKISEFKANPIRRGHLNVLYEQGDRCPIESADGARTNLQTVQDLIGEEPVAFDELIEKTGMDISGLSGIILNLRMKKLIKQLAGKQFVRS